jgi:cytochrome P450
MGDLMSILLQNDFTKNNDELIIDECMALFVAGSNTTSASLNSLIMHLAQPQNSNYLQQIRDEFHDMIFKPYFKDNTNATIEEALE